jgi:hypothetical protein
MLGTRNMFAWSFDRLAPEKLTTPLIAIVYYIGVRLYRRRQGMPLAQAFAEIPPE